MSIWNTLYTGASGLDAHGVGISVVGDNIANVSTVGFKGSRASFEDALGGTRYFGRMIGSGVRFGGAETLFGQGTFLQTGGVFDLAIRGSGWFVVKGAHDGMQGDFFSRDGRFHIDESGVLVNSEGLKVQGYIVDAAGNTATAPTDIVLDQTSPPNPTTGVELALNLDSRAIPPAAFDPLNASLTSNFSTSATVFDSLGASHRLDVFFRTSGAGAWEWHALVDGGELTAGVAGTPTEVANGTLSYTTTGALDIETVVASSADFVGATPGQVIDFDFGDAITTDAGTGLAGSTQFASTSNVTALAQDGLASGLLVDVLVTEDGTITGRFSNGQFRAMARVALATFASDHGLRRSGNQLFGESADSGNPIIAAAATGGRGSVSAGALEGSNVDLGTELVTLIAYQRAFQANARTISTADEMLAEIANLKR